jgi:NitT/TauT family transport system ATP-binding protein
MLRIEKVSKNFEEAGNLKVLDEISMDVGDKEFVCILGPSGCGKTIFLYLVAGFIKPTAGKIKVGGREVKEPDAKRIMIFQDMALFPWLTAGENIMFGLEKSTLPKNQKHKLVSEYLAIMGLEKFEGWYSHMLSGGMKQKVAVARALISDPNLLLMDEPFASLDPQCRKYMRQNLEKVWQASPKPVIFVTHSINEAVYLADTIHIFSSLPAKVMKTYRIDLPRPRDARSEGFLKIAKDIEKIITREFNLSMQKDMIGKKAIEKILNNLIIK